MDAFPPVPERSTHQPGPSAHPLSEQESAVAKLAADGRNDREIARELFIGIATVKFHFTHIYQKLSVNSRAELVARFSGLGV